MSFHMPDSSQLFRINMDSTTSEGLHETEDRDQKQDMSNIFLPITYAGLGLIVVIALLIIIFGSLYADLSRKARARKVTVELAPSNIEEELKCSETCFAHDICTSEGDPSTESQGSTTHTNHDPCTHVDSVYSMCSGENHYSIECCGNQTTANTDSHQSDCLGTRSHEMLHTHTEPGSLERSQSTACQNITNNSLSNLGSNTFSVRSSVQNMYLLGDETENITTIPKVYIDESPSETTGDYSGQLVSSSHMNSSIRISLHTFDDTASLTYGQMVSDEPDCLREIREGVNSDIIRRINQLESVVCGTGSDGVVHVVVKDINQEKMEELLHLIECMMTEKGVHYDIQFDTCREYGITHFSR